MAEAKIETPSGITDATLYWTTDTASGFSSVTMTAEPTDSFYAYIPAQPSGTQIFYYITAESNSGRTVSKPLTAPEGWWIFRVETPSATVGIKDPSATLYNPYPNPATTFVNIGFVLPQMMTCNMYVTDVLGRIVFISPDQTLEQGSYKLRIDVSKLSGGIYHIKLTAGNQVITKRFVVE